MANTEEIEWMDLTIDENTQRIIDCRLWAQSTGYGRSLIMIPKSYFED